MSALEQARADLATVLAGLGPDVDVCTEYPSRLAPPAAVLLAGTPYLSLTEPELPHGWAYARFDVLLVTDPGTNEHEDTALDALAVSAVARLIGSDRWHPEQLADPRRTQVGGGEFLAARLTARAPIPIT